MSQTAVLKELALPNFRTLEYVVKISLMKQRNFVTHRYTILQEIEQILPMLNRAIFDMFFQKYKDTNVSIPISLLFNFAAPTCFGNCVPSSRSSSVPSELHANLGFWLIKFCVVYV
jgi:hypothetical protein